MADKKNTAVQKQEKEERFVEYIPSGGVDKLRLTAAMVKNFIAVPTKSGALPTERDCMRFVMLAMGKRANPFEGDCYLVGYDTKNGPQFSIIAGIDLFLKRAENSENYDGRESGIVLEENGELVEREGCLLRKGESLVGGWAKVYRKDRAHPDYKVVSLSVYNTGMSRWAADPAGMIEKVALSQALRTAFPTALGGLHTREEMDHTFGLDPEKEISMPTPKNGKGEKEEAEAQVEAPDTALPAAIETIKACKTEKELEKAYEEYPQFHKVPEFNDAWLATGANIESAQEEAAKQGEMF